MQGVDRSFDTFLWCHCLVSHTCRHEAPPIQVSKSHTCGVTINQTRIIRAQVGKGGKSWSASCWPLGDFLFCPPVTHSPPHILPSENCERQARGTMERALNQKWEGSLRTQPFPSHTILLVDSSVPQCSLLENGNSTITWWYDLFYKTAFVKMPHTEPDV